jgi:hypothetical protein
MGTLALKSEGQVETVYFTRNALVVDLTDGRTISVPLHWYPKLLKASQKERYHWEICGGGYGIHWPDIDEDLSVEGLLRGAPASVQKKIKRHLKRGHVSSMQRARLKIRSKAC